MRDERDLYKEAEKRVKAKQGFYWHFGAFFIIGAFFFFVNAFLSSGYELWFYKPMIPWGVGIAFHYISVFGFPGLKFTTTDWQRQEIEKEMYKLDRDKSLRHGKVPPQREESLELDELEDLEEMRRYEEGEDMV